MRADAMQPRPKIFNEGEEGIANVAFVRLLVGHKPLAVVVTLELTQESEERRCKVRLGFLAHLLCSPLGSRQLRAKLTASARQSSMQCPDQSRTIFSNERLYCGPR